MDEDESFIINYLPRWVGSMKLAFLFFGWFGQRHVIHGIMI